MQRCPANWVAQGRTQRRKTTVDQTLMRGLVTARPVFVLSLLCLNVAGIKPHANDARRISLGGDKGFGTQDFVAELREINVTPHVAQNDKERRSAIDSRTTRRPGYAVSLRTRKRIEESV